MKAVQREDCDGLAQLLVKAGHLFKFLWIGHKARVQLLVSSVNVGDHQHHELHRSSPWSVVWPYTLSRLAAPEFDTHPNYVFRASGAAVLSSAAHASSEPGCSRGCAATTARHSARVVLVVAAKPGARLVASLGGAVEPLVHAPEAVESAHISGIGVVGDAILEYERTQARPIARVRGRVGSGHGRELSDRLRDRRRVHRVAAAPVVVFDAPLALLLLGERDVEVKKSLLDEDAKGNAHPIRRSYACSFARGARDTAQSITSWLARCTTTPLKPSAIAEQDGQPAV